MQWFARGLLLLLHEILHTLFGCYGLPDFSCGEIYYMYVYILTNSHE